jgi:hypothetical protein
VAGRNQKWNRKKIEETAKLNVDLLDLPWAELHEKAIDDPKLVERLTPCFV